MNVNEVIANRAHQLAGKTIGQGEKTLQPNDDVNKSQSSNDTFPTAMHIASYKKLIDLTIPGVTKLYNTLLAKSKEFDEIVKIGRTHLMDATPLTLGQEFSGYASQLEHGLMALKNTLPHLSQLALGGTAVGTGINAPENFGSDVSKELGESLKTSFQEVEDHFTRQGSREEIVQLSGTLKSLAVSLFKIANDIRWISSGPRCGFGEISLPAIQPGSSIMPGKVNPVLAESLTQVCAQVIGNDLTISIAGQSGNFELNVMMPVMAHNILESVEILSNSALVFANDCISGIEVDSEKCEATIEKSLAMCTSLAPVIGYDKAAAVAKKAFKEEKTVREVVNEDKILDKKEAAP